MLDESGLGNLLLILEEHFRVPEEVIVVTYSTILQEHFSPKEPSPHPASSSSLAPVLLDGHKADSTRILASYQRACQH